VTPLDELAVRFALPREQVDALDAYVGLLLAWRRGRVTGLRSRDEIVGLLLGDALALSDVLGRAADQEPVGDAARLRLLDLGSGGGVPGIPLAIVAPSLSVVLLDSVGKKCDFLAAAVTALGLSERVRIVCARSERLAARGAEGREAFDLVTARALGALAEVVELAAPALAPGGRLLALKTAKALEHEGREGEAAARACGLAPGPIVPLTSSPLVDSVCVTFDKEASTPDWLPRRVGTAGRRPLPAS
jgi:16S rRNA (guanine527-N7)-methyltransferase